MVRPVRSQSISAASPCADIDSIGASVEGTMLVGKGSMPAGRALCCIPPSSARCIHAVPPGRNASSTSGVAPREVHPFWASDTLLVRAIRRRQEAYRLRQVGEGARRKADQLEAIQLAKSEVRWLVQHIRKLQAEPSGNPSSSKPNDTLNRASRRQLVSMAMRMTRQNVPLSYLLGSVPFGSLPKELTVRPPILLPRSETEHWATEVVRTLVESLKAAERNAAASSTRGQQIRVVDLCTGSGCIALLIADALRTHLGADGSWKVVACDRSALAVELATENALKLGFAVNEDGAYVHIVPADIFSDADMDRLAQLAGGPFDLIVSNPPYVPRREWNALAPEVKLHEDPAALIGERDVSPASAPLPSTASSGNERDARQGWLDRAGLAFHYRLAELLYRPTFSTSSPCLPRLVAEYGKGQHRAVEKLHAELKAPKDRLPRIVRVQGHKLVVVGVGNATTHPLTKHSIGQVVLDPLLQELVEEDRKVRTRLREISDELEQTRAEAVESKRIDLASRQDWARPVPTQLRVFNTDGSGETRFDTTGGQAQPSSPEQLAKVGRGKSGGWAATISLLVAPTPVAADSIIYQVDVLLYKPSQPMNLSGVGLKAFLHAHHPRFAADAKGPAPYEDVLVLQDELDLAFGEVKRKDAGSARGHNGVRDILARLGIPDSPPALQSRAGQVTMRESGSGPRLTRLRIGIGRPDTSKDAKRIPIDRWVLSPLSADQLASCRSAQPGTVLDQVRQQTLGWLSDRCHTLASNLAHPPLTREPEHPPLSVRSSKDPFGILRTIWVG